MNERSRQRPANDSGESAGALFLIAGRMVASVRTLTLTSFDPGMLIFCDPPTFRAQAGRPSASWRQAHPNVALGDRAWPRVIVPCKDWPSATAYGGLRS
jgi:hypothetical protein